MLAAIGVSMALVATPFLVSNLRRLVAVGVLAVLFGDILGQLTGAAIFGRADELAAVTVFAVPTLVRLARGERLRRFPGMWGFALYLLAGFVSSTVHGVPAMLSAQSGFLFLKGFLFGFGVAQVDWRAEDVRRAGRMAGWVLAFILTCTAVNLVIPGPWAARTSILGGASERFGLVALNGPFNHPVGLGSVLALSAAAVVAWRTVIGKSPASFLLMAGAALGVVFSARRKALVGMVTAMFTARFISRSKRAGAAIALVLIVPLAGYLVWDQATDVARQTYAEYVTEGNDAARVIQARDSVHLAEENFPLGVGMGRFGSYLAGEHYSPVYLELGYPGVYGLGPNDSFKSDTFWPAVLGEAGVLGVLGYASGLLALARAGWRTRRARTREVALMGIILTAWSAEFAIESIAAPIYNAPPSFALLFGVAGVVAALGATASPSRHSPTTPLARSRR